MPRQSNDSFYSLILRFFVFSPRLAKSRRARQAAVGGALTAFAAAFVFAGFLGILQAVRIWVTLVIALIPILLAFVPKPYVSLQATFLLVWVVPSVFVVLIALTGGMPYSPYIPFYLTACAVILAYGVDTHRRVVFLIAAVAATAILSFSPWPSSVDLCPPDAPKEICSSLALLISLSIAGGVSIWTKNTM